jgi:hypothetical protein
MSTNNKNNNTGGDFRLKSNIHRNHRSLAALDTSNPNYKSSPVRRKPPTAIHQTKKITTKDLQEPKIKSIAIKPKILYSSCVNKSSPIL